jgi:mannose-6-phosphate isomerase
VLAPFRATPLPRERVWGGTRLARLARVDDRPIGELWLAGPWLDVASGPLAGRTLEEAATELGRALVGSAAPADAGPRFPLLVKLLDPAAWLSVQVHPDDAVARHLEGPGAVGKTEAWFVIEANPGAELLLGTRTGVTLDAVLAAIERPAEERGTAVVELMERVVVHPGDAFLVRAGTLHAVGPGAFLYELQQPSDLTYRVDDWGRPASTSRPLHTAQALASVRVGGPPASRAAAPGGRLATCPQFTLDLLDAPAVLDPGGRTLHVVTAVAGSADLIGAGWAERLGPLEALVVPADAGAYELRPEPGARALVAGLP